MNGGILHPVLGLLASAPTALEHQMKALPWGSAIVVIVWAALATLIVWKRGRLWAVARHTILQAVRMRLAIVLILFLVAILAVLPVVLRHDNTAEGKIRILVTYALYAAQFLLFVLTLFLSVSTLWTEMKQKQIYCLDTKPVPRWCVLAGKWVGVMMVNAFLLTVVGAILWAAVRFQARMPEIPEQVLRDPNPFVKQQVEEVRMAHRVLRSRLLQARAVATPATPNIPAIVEEEYQQRKRLGMLPTERSEDWIRMTLSNTVANQIWAVPPAVRRRWIVEGLPRNLGGNDMITVRFMYRGIVRPDRNEITGQWWIGRYDETNDRFLNPYFMTARLTKMCDTYHDITVPASFIDPETGQLNIFFYNPPEMRQPIVLFPLGRTVAGFGETDRAINVLYPVGGLGVNVLRAMMLLFTQLAYVAAAGLLCATFLTFPVATLAGLTMILLGVFMGFMISNIGDINIVGTSMVRPGTPEPTFDRTLRYALRYAMYAFPDFTPYNSAPYLSDGLAVPMGLIAHATFWLVVIRGTIMAALGGLIFYQRELAALDR